MTVADCSGGTFQGIVESPSVQRWLRSAGLSSASEAERADTIDLLRALCEFTGKGPDDLVGECLRTTKSGDRTISAKGRRRAEETIERFVESRCLTGHRAVVTANKLRGFLIHNGIFMQGPASIG